MVHTCEESPLAVQELPLLEKSLLVENEATKKQDSINLCGSGLEHLFMNLSGLSSKSTTEMLRTGLLQRNSHVR